MATVLGVFDQSGQDIVAELQQNLSTAYPPASDPGDYPHRRSGDLKATAGYVVTAVSDFVTLELGIGGALADYAAFLEYGTEKMAARPMMAPTIQNWTPILIDRLQSAFSGPSPVISPAGAIVPDINVAA